MADPASLLRPTAKRLLEALASGSRTLADLAAATGLRKPTLLPHLRALEALGIVERRTASTPTGRQVEHRLVGGSLHLEVRPDAGPFLAWASRGPTPPGFPLLAQVPDPEARAELATLLRHLSEALRGEGVWEGLFIVLLGSLARGQSTWKSDVDLLFVLEDDAPASIRARVEDALARAAPEVAHPPRAHFSRRSEFLEGRKALERAAAEEGLVLHEGAGDDELWRAMTRYGRISI